jgi:hypothetical protein
VSTVPKDIEVIGNPLIRVVLLKVYVGEGAKSGRKPTVVAADIDLASSAGSTLQESFIEG